MPLPVCETPELLLEVEAATLLIRWRVAIAGQRIETEHIDRGVRCRIVLEPVDGVAIPIVGTIPCNVPRDAPTECERDIMAVIAAAAHRLTQPQVFDALNAADKLHGESTIVKALARMVKDGRLSQVRRRGYGIPEMAGL